jgi:hypothetical protein
MAQVVGGLARTLAAVLAALALLLLAAGSASAAKTTRYAGTITISDVGTPKPINGTVYSQLGGRFIYRGVYHVHTRSSHGSLARRERLELLGSGTNKLDWGMDGTLCTDANGTETASCQDGVSDTKGVITASASGQGDIRLVRGRGGAGRTSAFLLDRRLGFGGHGGYALDLDSLTGGVGQGFRLPRVFANVDEYWDCVDSDGNDHGFGINQHSTYDNGVHTWYRDRASAGCGPEDSVVTGSAKLLGVWPGQLFWTDTGYVGTAPPLCRHSPLVARADEFHGVCGKMSVANPDIRGSRTVNWETRSGCPFIPRGADGRQDLTYAQDIPCIGEVVWERQLKISFDLKLR